MAFDFLGNGEFQGHQKLLTDNMEDSGCLLSSESWVSIPPRTPLSQPEQLLFQVSQNIR
jgi:hypothetical protein